jgi:hypothetical protein
MVELDVDLCLSAHKLPLVGKITSGLFCVFSLHLIVRLQQFLFDRLFHADVFHQCACLKLWHVNFSTLKDGYIKTKHLKYFDLAFMLSKQQ